MLRHLFTSGPVARSFLKDKTLTLQQGCGSDLREKTGSDPRKKTLDFLPNKIQNPNPDLNSHGTFNEKPNSQNRGENRRFIL